MIRRTHQRRPLGLPALGVPVLIALAVASAAAMGYAVPIGEKVQITLHDNRIDLPDTLKAGPTMFGVTNRGEVEHGLVVLAPGERQQLAKLDVLLKPGESATLEVSLTPGRFEVYCPLEGHRERGLAHRFVVVPERPPAEP